MITDKDRIDFLQFVIDEYPEDNIELATLADARMDIDCLIYRYGEETDSGVEEYCRCGTAYAPEDFDNLECDHSTELKWNPGSQAHTWTSWYRCSVCGELIEILEGE